MNSSYAVVVFGLETNFLFKSIPTNYRTRAIITPGLYIFYPIFEGQKRFFKKKFSEISALMYG